MLTFWMCFVVLSSRLHAGIVTLTASATATSSAVGYGTTTQSNSTQIVIPTNVTAKILYATDYATAGYSSTSTATGTGYLTIQVNGLSFQSPASVVEGSGAYIIGPATITLAAVEIIQNYGVVTGQDNALCTISTNQVNQSTATVSNYIPADAIVIPASATGSVQIILESSPDLVNWTAASPGTYGASAGTNRFFRVRGAAN